jgi:hypothetical protein
MSKEQKWNITTRFKPGDTVWWKSEDWVIEDRIYQVIISIKEDLTAGVLYQLTHSLVHPDFLTDERPPVVHKVNEAKPIKIKEEH